MSERAQVAVTSTPFVDFVMYGYILRIFYISCCEEIINRQTWLCIWWLCCYSLPSRPLRGYWLGAVLWLDVPLADVDQLHRRHMSSPKSPNDGIWNYKYQHDFEYFCEVHENDTSTPAVIKVKSMFAIYIACIAIVNRSHRVLKYITGLF